RLVFSFVQIGQSRRIDDESRLDGPNRLTDAGRTTDVYLYRNGQQTAPFRFPARTHNRAELAEGATKIAAQLPAAANDQDQFLVSFRSGRGDRLWNSSTRYIHTW